MASRSKRRGQRQRGAAVRGGGLLDYLKAAFFQRWNLLAFLGATAAAALSPIPGALLPLVFAAELIYLTGLISRPKFRSAVDARIHGQGHVEARSGAEPNRALSQIVNGLPVPARQRFERLRARCLEMRSIAEGVRGRTGDAGGPGEQIRGPSMNRLLWVFLRLLVSQNALIRFLETTDEDEIRKRLEDLHASLAQAQERSDERITRSLQDSIEVNEMRLENYQKAVSNAEFVNVELDRIEGKIRALTEMAVSRQDPDFLSRQVDSVAESMRHTEKAINELNLITGLTDELEEAPAILEADLQEELEHEA